MSSVSCELYQPRFVYLTDGEWTNLDGFMSIYGAGRFPLPSLCRQPLLLLFHPPLVIVLLAQESPSRGHGPFEQPFVPVRKLQPLARASCERMLAPAVRRRDVRARVPPPGRMREVREDVGGDVPPEGRRVRVAAAAAGGGLYGVAGPGVDPARAVDEAAHGGVVGGGAAGGGGAGDGGGAVGGGAVGGGGGGGGGAVREGGGGGRPGGGGGAPAGGRGRA